MSYENHTWETGEVITAAKLNNMEDGIDDKLVVTVLNTTTGEIDATYNDLSAAWTAKKNILLYADIEGEKMVCPLGNIWTKNGHYFATFISYVSSSDNIEGLNFAAESADGHMKFPGV